MMYALGRELEYHDMRQVRRVVRDAEAQNFTLSAIVAGIVASDAFRMQPHHTRSRPMYLTKKHLSRRTALKGIGVSVGLPLLDAMIPRGNCAGPDSCGAAPSHRVLLYPTRRDHVEHRLRRRDGSLDTKGRRRELRAQSDHGPRSRITSISSPRSRTSRTRRAGTRCTPSIRRPGSPARGRISRRRERA